MSSSVSRPRVALPLRGGCACGATRYSLSSAPVLLFACHCTLCQRLTGSAFGLSLRVRRDDLSVTGPTTGFERVTERGTPSESVFCAACGGRIFNARPGTEFCHLRAGTLDDTSWLRPAAHIWTASRQPWVMTEAETLIYEGQPASLDAMTTLWQARMAPDFG